MQVESIVVDFFAKQAVAIAILGFFCWGMVKWISKDKSKDDARFDRMEEKCERLEAQYRESFVAMQKENQALYESMMQRDLQRENEMKGLNQQYHHLIGKTTIALEENSRVISDLIPLLKK